MLFTLHRNFSTNEKFQNLLLGFFYLIILAACLSLVFFLNTPEASAATGHSACRTAYGVSSSTDYDYVLVAFDPTVEIPSSTGGTAPSVTNYATQIICGEEFEDVTAPVVALARWSFVTTSTGAAPPSTFYFLSPEQSSEVSEDPNSFEFRNPNNGQVAVVQLSEGRLVYDDGNNRTSTTVGDPLALFNIIQTGENAATPRDIAEGDEPEDLPPTCEERDGTTFGFVTCFLLRAVTGTLNFADRVLENMLVTPNDFIENQAVESAWTAFRSLAYILLVPILLVMVISTALGFEFVSAYTVKKALPRMIAATIFIAFSLEIAKFLIISVNTIGNGIQGFLAGSAGFEAFTLQDMFRPTGGADILTGVLGVGAAVAVTPWLINGGIFIVIGFLGSAAIALLVVLFLLAFRQVGIMILAILAPLAILAWIFPGNTKLWGLWRATFLKLLLLYPVIMLAIGAGKLFAGILAGMSGEIQTELLNDSGDNDTNYIRVLTNRLLILVAYVGPYFFIPTLFKAAGGAFGKLAGIANNKERGLMDRSKNWGRKEKEDRSSLNKASKEMRKRKKNIDILTGDKEGFGKNNNLKRTRRALTSVRTRGGLTAGGRIEEDTLREAQIERSNQEEKAATFDLQQRYSKNTAAGIDRKKNLKMLEDVATSTDPSTTHAQRKAANKLLTQQQAVENLARVREAGLDSQAVANGWNDTLGENFGTLSTISPDLANEVITAKGSVNEAQIRQEFADNNVAAFGKVGPQQYVNMKADGWDRYFSLNKAAATKAWNATRTHPDYGYAMKQEVVDAVEGIAGYVDDPTKTPEQNEKKRYGLLGAGAPRPTPAMPARDPTPPTSP